MSSSNSGAMQGCLSGSGKNLMLQANGKSYSLQGSTTSAQSLVGHQVEVTGDVSGSAVNVSNIRDLGTTCSAK